MSTVPVFDFKTIQTPLFELITAMPEWLDREKNSVLDKSSRAPHLRTILRAQVQIACWTFRGILFLGEEKGNPYPRHIEYMLTTLPLIRSLVDAVYTIAFLFDDLDDRLRWYLLAAWSSTLREHESSKSEFGTRPEYAPYLNIQAKMVADLEVRAKPLAAQLADPKTVKRWPHSGRMRDYCKYPETKQFLVQLDTLLYGELSEAVHHKLPGVLNAAAFLEAVCQKSDEKLREAAIQRTRADVGFRAITLLLAVFSEVAIAISLHEPTQKLSAIWQLVIPYRLESKAIYEYRYEAALTYLLNNPPVP